MVNGSQILKKYFSSLPEETMDLLSAMEPLYRDLNSKINVISRKDIDHLFERHVLHSLAIQKLMDFQPGTTVLDLGTGGGFPGIPLAIVNESSTFTLIDGTRKKISVVQEVIDNLGLSNVTALQTRAEYHKGEYQYIVSRAVGLTQKLIDWSRHLISREEPAGWILLKGGDLRDELKGLPKRYVEIVPIREWFQEAFFDDKKIVFIDSRAILH